MPTVSYGITNTADDVCYTSLSGSVFPDALIVGNLAPILGEGFSIGGIRFPSVAIPPGSAVTSASITLKRQDTAPTLGVASGGTTFGRLKGVAVDNAPAWSVTGPQSAALTSAGADITNGASVAINVTSIVQEVVGRSGWTSGNALAFASEVGSADGFVEWIDYQYSSTDCAQLSITYEAGGPDVTAPTVTSDDALSVIEGDALTHALTANEDVTWTKVGGADAASFTLTGSTLSLSAQTYPSGPFVVVVRATDAAGNWTEQTITVTVTQAPLIRFIGESVGTTSATIKPHQPGDLIVAFAFRDGSATLPTLPTGQDWASLLAPTGANTCSMRLAAKIADTPSEATGTFTSATSLIVHVYRPRPGTTLSVGAAASASGASTTVSFPALTLQDASGNSFVAGFAGHRSVNTTLESPPTGMVNRSTVVDATDEAAGHDTNGGVTSWPLTTKAVGGTSSGWFGATVEIKATSGGSVDGNASGSAITVTPTLTSGVASGVRSPTATGVSLTATSSLLTGSASGVRNASQTGASFTATASLTAGGASAARSGAASGQTFTVTAGLTGGASSAVRSPTTAGQAFTTTASLLPGAVSAIRSPTVSGSPFTLTASLASGTASAVGNASATGAAFTASVSLAAGSASASAAVSGANLAASASLLAGVASGQATVAGQAWTVTASLTEGTATAAATGQASGATLIAYASFTAGAASGQRNVSAAGQALTASVSLSTGIAAASSGALASGANLTTTASLTSGAASGSARTSGGLLSLSSALRSGAATGQATASGAVWTVYALFTPGLPTSFIDVPTPPERRAVLLREDRKAELQPDSRRVALAPDDRSAPLEREARRATLTHSSRRIALL